MEGDRGLRRRAAGFSTYLRLTTRPVEQALADPIRERLGEEEWRRQVLAGGYLLPLGGDWTPGCPRTRRVVNVAARAR